MAQKDPDPLFILRANSSITSLAFSFLGSLEVLVTGSQNGLIEIWNLKTKRTMINILTGAHEILYADIIHFNKDFYLVGHNRSGLVQFFKIEDFKHCLKHSLLVHNVGFASINILKEKDIFWLAYPSSDSEVSVSTITSNVSTESKDVIYTMKPDIKVGMVMKCMLFIRDTILYLICAYEDGSICLWNDSSMLYREKVYEDPVMSMDTDGRKIITASTGNKIHLYNIDENFHLIQVKQLETMSCGYSVLSIRSDKKIVVCGSWNGIVRLYSWKKMKPLAILKYHNKGISSVVYSSENIIGIAARDGKISIWDVYKNT